MAGDGKGTTYWENSKKLMVQEHRAMVIKEKMKPSNIIGIKDMSSKGPKSLYIGTVQKLASLETSLGVGKEQDDIQEVWLGDTGASCHVTNRAGHMYNMNAET